ncbi:unnamed protein product [Moneuplotes crassus]|uniref:Uncharacterized protein n=1 Tax=Euplotes crassus TaxID=5936 RepID=A0AAD1Y1F5_EUPCR|nr:unnamed protein product [Moneuplotes crassus]
MSQKNTSRGRQRLNTILEERKAHDEKVKRQAAETEKQSWRNRVFGFTKRFTPEDMPEVDIKGHRQKRQSAAGVKQSQIERQLYQLDNGPRMLTRRQRFRAWRGLSMLGLWFAACFFLIQYRLKSDDLELMEREVYEDLSKKREVERMQAKQAEYD